MENSETYKKDDKQIKFNFRQHTILNVIFLFFHNFCEFILKCRKIWSTRSTACKVMTVRVTWLVFSASVTVPSSAQITLTSALTSFTSFSMISREEILKPIWHAFTALDMDQNGKVSKSQLKVSEINDFTINCGEIKARAPAAFPCLWSASRLSSFLITSLYRFDLVVSHYKFFFWVLRYSCWKLFITGILINLMVTVWEL